MDKRDTILAKLALGLGLIDDAGLQRAIQLRARFPGLSFDRLLLQARLVDEAGWRRLVHDFNQRLRAAQAGPQAASHAAGVAPLASPPAAPPGGTPPHGVSPSTRAGPPTRSGPAGPRPGPAAATDPGLGAVPRADRAPIRSRSGPPLRRGPDRPPAGGAPPPPSDPELELPPDDEAELALPPDDAADLALPPDDEADLALPPEDEATPAPERLVIPVDDDDSLQDDSSDELDALFEQPTMVLEAEEPPDEDDEDRLLAEPTLVLEDASAKRAPRPRPADDEDALLAQPTVVLGDDAGGPAPPVAEELTEDELLAQPTMIVQDEPAAPPEADEDALLAQPTVVLQEGGGSPSGSGELEIDTNLASSRRRRPGPLTPGVRSKQGGGPLDREEFQRRLKMRLPCKGYALGDYKIVGELSRGAFGMVFEVEPDGVAKSMARERGYSGNLALKVMLENTSDPRETERFLDEVRVLIGFDHPHIVRIFDAGVENGLTYYSMELVRGVESRTHVLKKGPMPPLLAVRVVKEVASALGYVHAQQIYHRDLKPQNVMLDQAAQPYRSLLIDFGLVQEQAAGDKDAGLIMGTPSYMPPEQAQPRGGHGPVNATSDLYSLGATMYFLLTGKPPFAGRDPRKIIKMVVSQDARDPVELNAQIPRRIADVCLKLLAKKQEDRYPSALKLEQDLDKELRSGRMKLKAKSILGRFLGRPKK